MTQENWVELEKFLSNVLQRSKGGLDDKNIDILDDFIDNREYGVAYEWIASLVSEGKLVLEPDVEAELNAAGALMGFAAGSIEGSAR